MIDPRFSVVIPVHNKARHVTASVASALQQTRPPSEIILIDDASTDGSAAILSKMTDPCIRLLFRDTPGPGGYAARNLGMAEANGNWIAFLDADDIWHPSHLADMAAAIEAAPEAGCVATRYDHVFTDHRKPSKMTDALASVAGRSADFREALDIWVQSGECPIWTSAAAFRHDLLHRAGSFPAGKAVRGGDKDMWLRALSHAPFTYVPKVSAEFHRDTDNKVSKTTNPDSIPILVNTARAMMATASEEERTLLRKLINQQIGLYARFSFKGGEISSQFSRNLCLPEGFGLFLMIEAARLMPPTLRHKIYRAIKGT
ncbi:glycosyltransferase family 2 protein [Sphingorhabdus sp. EL138]|uniref:glycosyltransferase family 2 protein n=1 Tax=Sphingorhabdus sp. EL138 TaxID=2073156 RepID=UPI0013A58917|nr:glycosyltransferase family 2 protein [Sphingorhabdus sp. EL138]